MDFEIADQLSLQRGAGVAVQTVMFTVKVQMRETRSTHIEYAIAIDIGAGWRYVSLPGFIAAHIQVEGKNPGMRRAFCLEQNGVQATQFKEGKIQRKNREERL